MFFNWNWKRAIFSNREDHHSTVTSNNCTCRKSCRCPVTAGAMINTASKTGTFTFSVGFLKFEFWAMATTIIPTARQACLHPKPGEPMATKQPFRRRHSCCTHVSDGCHLRGQMSSWEEHQELTAQTSRQCCVQETTLTSQLCQLTYSLNLDKLSQFQMSPFSHY